MIAIGSDHAAFEFKEHIKIYLQKKGLEFKDFGTFSTERTDYCDFGFKVAESVANKEAEKGILVCGTGVGISISANKVKSIRAVVCSEPYSAKLSRQHNNTNILAMGSRVVGTSLAEMIIDEWLEAEFEGGRHLNRINKIGNYEQEC